MRSRAESLQNQKVGGIDEVTLCCALDSCTEELIGRNLAKAEKAPLECRAIACIVIEKRQSNHLGKERFLLVQLKVVLGGKKAKFLLRS